MLLAVFLPFLNFLIIAGFGRFIGKIGAIYASLFAMALTAILNIVLFLASFWHNLSFFVSLGPWITVERFNVQWEFLFDPLSLTILAIVSIVSLMVHVYSISYIKNDPHFLRFMSFLSLFTFFMFILVTSGNFIQLFLGWEGVGICSYLLINFWYTRVQANKAAIKALIINRIGDIGYLLGVILVFALYNSVDFTVLHLIAAPEFSSAFFVKTYGLYHYVYSDVICFFFLIGVIGKSAQLGLHTWLPAAMEGPTPVSALIHAATIVTAGIFLLIRTSFLFELSPSIRSLIVILGAFTAVLSAFTAIFLYDIKRIIAYSTCSQLGYMAIACGLSQYSVGLFHLVNHAFFKALLFLTAGAIIHSFNNEQDIRKLSGLSKRAPFLLASIVIGNIAIIGLPFLSGFYSKDIIIELSFLTNYCTLVVGPYQLNVIFILIMFATLFTAIYSLRLFYFLFIRKGTRQTQKKLAFEITQPIFIQIALFVLILGSLFSGYVLSDLFSSTSDFYAYSNYRAIAEVDSFYYFENEFLPLFVKLAPLFANFIVLLFGSIFFYCYHKQQIPQYTQMMLALISSTEEYKFLRGACLNFFYAYIFYNFNIRGGKAVRAFQNNFYFNEIYNYIAFTQHSYYYSHIFCNLDKGVLELLGPRGLAALYLYVAKNLSTLYKQGLASHLFLILGTLLALFYYFDIFLWG